MMSASPSSESEVGPTQPIPKKSLQIRTDKPRPHVCSICTRAFARLEHLKRHERSHTNEKPFQCAACGRCFARRDLVLRHQQKLHSHVTRRSLISGDIESSESHDVSAPAAASATGETDPDAVPSNDHIIVLHNNTHPKAPLPDGSSASSPNFASSHSSPGAAAPHYRAPSVLSSQKHAIPSPNTSSSINTPSNVPSQRRGSNHTASSAPTLASSEITQQPLPATGDSPDLKEKKKPFAWNQSLAADAQLPSSVNRLPHQLQQQHQLQLRHTSFSAVSGLSYTNLKDALSIESHAFPDAPPQVGFATPQLTAAEIDSKGLSSLDYGNLVSDWYCIDGSNLPNDLSLNHLHPGALYDESHHLPDHHLDHASTASTTPSSALTALNSANGRFHSNLNTIPSESHIAKNLNISHESSSHNQNHMDSSFLSSRYQNFFDPNHPHYLKGTTPLAMAVNLNGDAPSGYFDDHFAAPSSAGPNGSIHQSPERPPNASPPGPGTSVFEMVNDLSMLDQQPPKKPQKKQQSRGGSIKKLKQSSVALNKDFKRAKLGFSNDTENLDWVNEIMAIPIQNEFPTASHDTGFVGMPYLSNEKSDEMLSLFKHRQDSLVRQRSLLDAQSAANLPPRMDHNGGAPMSRKSSKVHFTIGGENPGGHSNFVTDELRNRIIMASNLSDAQFPPLEDLNSYTSLYESEFNAYFPFIHMPSLRNPMVDNYENIPLILSMCAIGALYSYHDSNTLLLFNLSKFHIHNFFDKEVTVDKLQFKKVPLMAHQSLVLHIFISIFLNEPNMVEITSKQINSMVGLIRSTNFHKPLEQFLVPPPPIKSDNETGIIQNNFDYFIMAQTRIRTIHCFYELETIRSILLGFPLPMNKDEVLNGTNCADEALFRAESATEWYEIYKRQPEKDLVKATNNEALGDLYKCLCEQVPIEKPLPINTLFSLLMCVHENILNERRECQGDVFKWNLERRPKLGKILRAWEAEFAKNGGLFVVNERNQHLLRKTRNIQVVMALGLLAKIRLCLDVTSMAQYVVLKDWNGMITQLRELKKDSSALKEAAGYAKEILEIWLHNISSLDNAKTVSVRTPVFFVTCVFFGVFVMATTLQLMETQGEPLSMQEQIFWLEASDVLSRINNLLSYSEDSNSYAEFLRRLSGGAFDEVLAETYPKRVSEAAGVVQRGDGRASLEAIQNVKLSTQTLSLGVRIFADAPLWPIAMGFAEALKNTACFH